MRELGLDFVTVMLNDGNPFAGPGSSQTAISNKGNEVVRLNGEAVELVLEVGTELLLNPGLVGDGMVDGILNRLDEFRLEFHRGVVLDDGVLNGFHLEVA